MTHETPTHTRNGVLLWALYPSGLPRPLAVVAASTFDDAVRQLVERYHTLPGHPVAFADFTQTLDGTWYWRGRALHSQRTSQ